MAVFALAPAADEFERARALGGIARMVLDARLICGVLALGWLALADELHPGAMIVAALLSVWQLLALVRWDAVGATLSIHPVLLAVDVAACLAVTGLAEPLSPVLLLPATGAVFVGLCLGVRGAAVFTLLLGLGWWLVMSGHRPETAAEGYIAWVLAPVGVAGALFLGSGIRRVVLLAAEAEHERRQQTRLAGVAEERARLAREMHDSLVKTLHGVVMMARSLPAWMERDQTKAAVLASRIGDQLEAATAESRALLVAMRRAQPADPLATQVTESVRRWRDTSGRRAEVEVIGNPVLAPAAAYELLAILDELLENVSRHTPPTTRVTVALVEDHGWVRLEVVDDGPGTDVDLNSPGAARPGHFGVVGIRERAARAGGRASFTSNPGHGTVVEVRLPRATPVEEELLP